VKPKDVTTPHWWERIDWTIVVQHVAIIISAFIGAYSAKRRNDV
jgi:hypothetical protein